MKKMKRSARSQAMQEILRYHVSGAVERGEAEAIVEQKPLLERTCGSCHGRGWIVAENDVHGRRIERCDNCQMIGSDEAAVDIVAAHAIAWARQKVTNR